MGMSMRLWIALPLVGTALFLGGSDGEARAAPREVSAPLNLMAVARSPAPAKTKSTKRKRVASPVVVAPPAEPAQDDDVTGAVGGKDGQGVAGGSGGRPAPGTRPAAAKPSPPSNVANGANANDAAQFCSNVVDAASDARLAWQMKELEKAEGLLRQRIADLEAKRAEYETWLKLREDFLRKAEDNVVEIYSRMKPDAAALQLASMIDETAAAVLAKLTPRSSSAILNEMEPARAAHLANTLAGMRQTGNDKGTK